MLMSTKRPQETGPVASWPEGTMSVMLFTGNSSLDFAIKSIPEPMPGTVLVRVDHVGLCGTDLHLYSGHSAYIRDGLTQYPFVPGHEFSGIVVATGPGVENAVVGRRVVGQPFLPCKRCTVCQAGRLNLCPSRFEQGVRGNVPGAAAQYIRMPQENLAVVPDSVRPAHAVLAESSVTSLSSVIAGGARPGSRVGVIGTGAIGLLAVQIAVGAGCEVDAVGIDTTVKLATECGAQQTYGPDTVPTGTYDVVIEAAGAATSLALAIKMAAPGATITQTSIPGAMSTDVDAAAIVSKGLSIVGILGGIPYLQSAVNLITSSVIRPDLLIDSVRPWREAPEALSDMQSGRLARPKVILSID